MRRDARTHAHLRPVESTPISRLLSSKPRKDRRAAEILPLDIKACRSQAHAHERARKEVGWREDERRPGPEDREAKVARARTIRRRGWLQEKIFAALAVWRLARRRRPQARRQADG
jgi:hypothetical protein